MKNIKEINKKAAQNQDNYYLLIEDICAKYYYDVNYEFDLVTYKD